MSIYVANAGQPTVVVADYRLKTDSELDTSEPHDGTHVLDMWSLGRFAFGRDWRHVTRVALFDPAERPSSRQAAERREQFLCWLTKHRPRMLFVLPTPDSTMGAEATALRGTQAWLALAAPDNLAALRGTRWLRDGTEVVALFPIAKRVKELERWCMANWLRAHRMPTSHPKPQHLCITPSHMMLALMADMAGKPLAVDLEFHPGEDLITAVGLSDGTHAVSIPMDAYHPRNTATLEPGLQSYDMGARVALALKKLLAADTPKIAHNFVADIPRLKRRQYTIGGPVHDTFAAHAIAFPELRHGLQAACASMLAVPPWKSIYKPTRLAKGITRDDAEYWLGDPEGLRRYNTLDALYTRQLATAVMPHVGVSLV